MMGIYSIWLREVKRYLRDRSQVFSTIFTSLLWLVIFGIGIGSMRFGRISDYQSFLFPGIVGMALLVTSIRSGISVIRDRDSGFLRFVLVAPVEKREVVFGKILGGVTVAVLQGVILLILSFVAGLHISFVTFLYALALMIIISAGLVCIGLIIASQHESMEGFNMIMSLLIMPMFFLSGALFPIRGLPDWLQSITYFNPLTYGVDALRTLLAGESVFTLFSLKNELIVLVLFAVFMQAISIKAFEKSTEKFI